MKRSSVGVVVVAAVLFAAGLGTAVGQPRHERMMCNSDPSTEVTVTGTVTEVVTNPTSTRGRGRRARTGMHLMVTTDEETLEVHVGPADFITSEGLAFEEGDELEITGSRVTVDGAEALIAREIKKGQAVLVLRNEQGVPRWSGGPCSR
jgi:hypothetical protein